MHEMSIKGKARRRNSVTHPIVTRPALRSTKFSFETAIAERLLCTLQGVRRKKQKPLHPNKRFQERETNTEQSTNWGNDHPACLLPKATLPSLYLLLYLS